MTFALHIDPAAEGVALSALGGAADSRKQRLDGLARLVCRVFAAPIALIAISEPEGETVTAAVGLITDEIAAGLALSAAALAVATPIVVPDAATDPRFARSPLVARGPRVRFLAAQRLTGPSGVAIGSLCVFDRRHREQHPAYLEALADLAVAAQVEIHALALQRAYVQQSEGLAQARAIIELTADGVLLCDERGAILAGNGPAAQLFGYEPADLSGVRLDFLVPSLHPEEAEAGSATDLATLPALAAEPREAIARRRSGEALLVRLGARALSGEAGDRWLVLVHDVADGLRGEAQRRRRLALSSLRELPDRAYFRGQLDQAFALAARSGGVAVLLLELDSFDTVVEKLGRQAADALLLEAYRRLRTCLRPDDKSAYLGGSAFAVLFEGLSSTRDVQRPAERILGQLRTPLSAGRSELLAAPNIGIALSSLCLGASGVPDLIREADEALREARAAGRWRLQVVAAHEHPSGGAISTPAHESPAAGAPPTMATEESGGAAAAAGAVDPAAP